MRRSGSRVIPAAILALAGVASAQSVDDPWLVIEPYATGFTSPSFFRFLPVPPPAPAEFLVCEIGHGRVLHYRGGMQVGVALDLAVAFMFERGLFGLALHPDFATTQPYVYLYYTASNTGGDTSDVGGAADNRVVRTRWNGATLDSLTVLLQLPVGTNHNGGALAFGPDGMLYGSIGEAGSTMGQLQNVAAGPPPNGTSMIFRLGADGTIPADNPFVGLGGPIENVWAYGLRNVFGIDFDPVTGALWFTDNGASTYDEIDRGVPGMNGGWRRLMGPSDRNPAGLADLWVAPGSSYVDPAFSFLQSFGITAVHFQRGPALGPEYDGDLFVAAHNSMTIYHFEMSPDRAALAMPAPEVADRVADDAAERDLFQWATGVGVVTDMETGPDGALYVLRFSTPEILYRVRRLGTSAAPPPVLRPRLVLVPNPFRDRTQARFPGGGTADDSVLRVYDASGRLVRALGGRRESLEWDGCDAGGRQVAPGTYLVRWTSARHRSLGELPQEVVAKAVRVE